MTANKIMTVVVQRRKAIAALIGNALIVATALYGGTNKYIVMATALVAAMGVYGVPNEPKSPTPTVKAVDPPKDLGAVG